MTVEHVTPTNGNIFADLGLPDAGERLIKSQLSAQILRTIRSMKLTQDAAAALMGISQPRLSNILRGRFDGVSEDRLMRCLAALGQDVTIVVGAPHEGAGRIAVEAA